MKALKDGLRKLGYIEGQNLKVEYRYLLTGGASAETLAAELVKLGPDIIITLGTRGGDRRKTNDHDDPYP